MGRSCYICGSFAKPLFEFPQDKTERKKWIQVLQNSCERKLDYKSAVLCTKHFSPDSLDYSRRSIKLNPGAIPIAISVDIEEQKGNGSVENNDKSIRKSYDSKNGKNTNNEASMINKADNTNKSMNESEDNILESEESSMDLKAEAVHPGKPALVSKYGNLSNDERIRLLTSNNFVFEISQIPPKLAQPINEALHSDDEDIAFLEKVKVHCTVCQRHIGAAPVEQICRFIHPDLNTILCEACFIFHGSGEFTKDEDGSEIYCKWCAQGGTVMCCSDCPLVFCQQCVQNNLGVKKLKEIEDLDDWKCFKCDPVQLSHLQTIAFVLHRYTIKRIAKILLEGNPFLLMLDITKCCCTRSRKRKRSDSDDENDEFLGYKQRRKGLQVKSPAVSKDFIHPKGVALVNKAVDEAVKNVQPIQPKPLIRTIPISSLLEKSLLNPTRPIKATTITSATAPALAQLMPNLPTLLNSTRIQVTSTALNSIQPSTSTVTSSLQHPILAPRMPGGLAISQRMPAPLRGLVPIAPKGENTAIRIRMIPAKQETSKNLENTSNFIKTSWLMNSVSESKDSFQKLVLQAEEIQREAKRVKTHGHLAGLHNRMQHAMSKCTNALIETRKKMHREFLNYLSKMNVSHSSYAPNGNVVNNIQTGARLPGTIHLRPNQPVPQVAGFAPNMTRLQRVPRPRAIIYPQSMQTRPVLVNRNPVLLTKSKTQLLVPKTALPIILPKATTSVMTTVRMPTVEKDPLALDEEHDVDPAMLQPEVIMQVDTPPIVEPVAEPPITIKIEKVDPEDVQSMRLIV